MNTDVVKTTSLNDLDWRELFALQKALSRQVALGYSSAPIAAAAQRVLRKIEGLMDEVA